VKINITNPYREFEQLNNVNLKIEKVLKSGSYIGGNYLNEFESSLQNFLKIKYVTTVNSGTDALTLSLLSMGISKGDEILVPSFTFFATVESILLVGATPVFVDIDLNNYCLDLNDLCSKITKKTKVIIPVHLFGNNSQIEKIVNIAKSYKILVLEDSAQSFGSMDSNQNYLGTIGDIGAFSFYPSKTLGGIGDGGLVATNNKKYYNSVQLLKNHGQSKNYLHKIVGMNSRLDTVNAAVLNEKLKIFDKIKKSRNELFTFYCDNLSSAEWISLPKKDNPNILFNYFTIFVSPKIRTNLINYLNENGIGNSIYYKRPIHLQPVINQLSNKRVQLKNTEIASKSVLSLPYFPFAKKIEMEYIVSKLLNFKT